MITQAKRDEWKARIAEYNRELDELQRAWRNSEIDPFDLANMPVKGNA